MLKSAVCQKQTQWRTQAGLPSSHRTVNCAGYRKVNHATSGCLTCVRPDGTVTVLRRDLAFANGVVLAPDESFLLVAETIGYRILKFWLKSPRANGVEFVTGTPGFPDNISLSESGLVWVSLPGSRVPALDFLLPRHPILRQLAQRVPQRLASWSTTSGPSTHDSLSSPRCREWRHGLARERARRRARPD